jgi:CO dehydrogenase maturation factor
VRGVVSELGTLRPEDVTILDMEASIEHLTRGTLRDVEVLLIVAEPYFRALQTLERTVPLARELGIPRLYVVANKVRAERDLEAIQQLATRAGVELIAIVPFDEAVQQADRENRALIDYAPLAPATAEIAALVDRLLPVPEAAVAD